jgi:hypothetical protein
VATREPAPAKPPATKLCQEGYDVWATAVVVVVVVVVVAGADDEESSPFFVLLDDELCNITVTADDAGSIVVGLVICLRFIQKSVCLQFRGRTTVWKQDQDSNHDG